MKTYLAWYKKEKTFKFQTRAMNIEKPYKCDICDMIITQAVLLYCNFVKSWVHIFYPWSLSRASQRCTWCLSVVIMCQMLCTWPLPKRFLGLPVRGQSYRILENACQYLKHMFLQCFIHQDFSHISRFL